MGAYWWARGIIGALRDRTALTGVEFFWIDSANRSELALAAGRQTPQSAVSVMACPVDDCGADIAANGLCVTHYRRVLKSGDPHTGGPLRGHVGKCMIDGCEKPCRSRKAIYCNVHFHRMWRTGSPDLRPPKHAIEHSRGYVLERTSKHPLTPNGERYIYQHRRVYFDTFGQGPFHCHVCAARVTWATLHIDHLDDDPTNNDVSNLAPACPTCNQARGREKMVKTKKANGRLLTFNGETLCLSDWASRLGIARGSLRRRIESGWPTERAFMEGRGRFGPKRRP